MQSQTLGIFGGTFDPIHLGHLHIAKQLAEFMKIEKVHIIPSFRPVHRDATIATTKQRLEMVKLAAKDNPFLIPDAREILRGTPSYTIDTLLELRDEYPDTTFCLFLGYDAFLEFHTWHNYLEILELAHLVVAKRPNVAACENGPILDLISARFQKNIEYIQTHKSGGIFLPETTELDISAKEIRKEIAIGRDPGYLLPNNVYQYIQLNGIYQK